MNHSVLTLFIGASAALLAGCGPNDSIDSSGAVFDGIAPDTAITMIGTEPFWGLTIDAGQNNQHSARLAQPGEAGEREFTVTRFAGNNGLGFSGSLDGKAVQIALTPGECSDQMSDRAYPFTATVKWGDAMLMGCAHTASAPFTGPETP